MGKFNNIDKLGNFKIHAYGNIVMISGYTINKGKHTFVASTSILKHILFDMNQSVTLGALSKCQLGGIFSALKSIGYEYDLVMVNNQPMIVPRSREVGFQRVQVKK